jgi:YidC/Oxa1 family membrane protein insertase
MLSTLFNVVLYKPIFNIFVLLYNIVPGHDLGIVILGITILIRIVLYPLTSSSIKAQKSLQELQPKMDELKKKHAEDKQALAQATMELYKTHQVNPFKSCLPMLIQLPILIALYLVLQNGINSSNLGETLYSFVHNPGILNPISFGFLDLSKPQYILAVLAGFAQFLQSKSLMAKNPSGTISKTSESGEKKQEDMMAAMNKQMIYFMPIMTVLIGLRLPAGLTLYWFLSTLLMWLQQLFLSKKHGGNKIIPPSQPSANHPPVIEGQVVK